MLVRRLPLVLLSVSLLVLAPAAQATETSPTRLVLQRLDDWTDGFQQLHSSVRGSSESKHVSLFPLGDADGDGHGDLAVMRMAIHADDREVEFESTLSGLSGSDLATSLWKHVPKEGAMAFPVADADGDAVLDILVTDVPDAPMYSTISAPIPFAYAGDFAYSFAHDATVASGKDLSDLAKLTGKFEAKGQSVGAFPLVGSAGAYKEDVLFQFSNIMAAGSVLSSEMQLNATGTFAGTFVGAGGGQHDQDLTVALQGLDGQASATIVRDDPDLIAFDFQMLGVSGQAAPDLVVLEAKPTAPAGVVFGVELPFSATPGPSPVLAVHDGETGAELWTVVRDAVDLDAGLLPSPGDMDGDGHDDLAFFEAWTDPTDGPFAMPHLRTTVFSGADGAILGTVESDEAMTVLLPFGNVVGDAAAEALRLDFGFNGDEMEFSASLVGADLEAIWTIDAMDTFPLNFVFDAYTGMPKGFSDLTGDNLPDLALVVFPAEEEREAQDEEEPATVVSDMPIKLLDGITGKPVWEQTFAGLVDARLVPDLSGAGAGDLLLVRLEGFEGPDAALEDATLLYESIRAETGSVLRSQVLRSPALDPLDPGMLEAYAGPLGDLDGDGTEDIGVEVLLTHATSVSSVGGSMVLELSTDETWMVFSGATGEALGAFTNEGDVDQAAKAAPLQVLPASDAVVQESAAAPLALLLIAFLALARRARRDQ